MARTTLDIEAPVLRDLKRLQKEQGKSLGRLASELLAQALAERKKHGTPRPRFRWTSVDMGAPSADLRDKEALYRLLDGGRKR